MRPGLRLTFAPDTSAADLLADISVIALQASSVAEVVRDGIAAEFAKDEPRMGSIGDTSRAVEMSSILNRLVRGLPAAASQAGEPELAQVLARCAALADAIDQRVLEGNPEEQRGAGLLAELLAHQLAVAHEDANVAEMKHWPSRKRQAA